MLCKIPRDKLEHFINWLEDKYLPCYGLIKEGERVTFGRIENPGNLYVGGVRSLNPFFKTFLFSPREKVAAYFGEDIIDADTVEETKKDKIIIGFKACDLKALSVYDNVFRKTLPPDPFYVQRRKSFFIISWDCTEVLPTCFCTFVEGSPYPQTGYDLNLTPLDDVIYMEVGSWWGEEVVKKYPTHLGQPEDDEKLKIFREEIKRKVAEVNSGILPLNNPYTFLLRTQFDSPVWSKKAETCVACGGCTAICPTCYCNLLYDEVEEERFERIRIWDYCQYPKFAQEAGGANPRKRLVERFRHRYAHKFDYAMVRNGMYECTGCGRCISVCPGKIDMRDTLRLLDKEKVGSEQK